MNIQETNQSHSVDFITNLSGSYKELLTSSIFSHFSLSDYENCRLVCRNWKIIFEKELETKKTTLTEINSKNQFVNLVQDLFLIFQKGLSVGIHYVSDFDSTSTFTLILSSKKITLGRNMPEAENYLPLLKISLSLKGIGEADFRDSRYHSYEKYSTPKIATVLVRYAACDGKWINSIIRSL